MKKFRVLVTRDATESCQVEVEAKNKKEAESRALEIANEEGKWEVDDGNFQEPYICDPGNCADEIK